jgi:GNAT superfamily N-acetyltransferase
MIQVRKAHASDRDAIVDFQVRLAKESEGLDLDLMQVEQGVQAVFDRPQLGAYWVAEWDGQVAGCLLTTPEWSDWRNGTVMWVQSLYVLPEFRQRGIFRALFETLHGQVLQSKESIGLRLYVDKRNTTARRVYEKLGMDGRHYDLFEWLKATEVRSKKQEARGKR